MSINRILAPLAAVAMVAVLAGAALIASPRSAEAAAVAATGSTTAWVVWNNNSVPTTNPGITVTEPGATTWSGGDTVVITHTGITSSASAGATCTNCTVAYGANTTTITITAVTGGVDTASLDRIDLKVTANGAATTFPVTVGSGASSAGSVTSQRLVVGWNPTTTVPSVINRTTPSFSADGNAAGGAVCAFAADAAGNVMTGLPITFTVSLGVVSTGTAKSAIALTSTAGGACTNYRGGGGIATTDTVIPVVRPSALPSVVRVGAASVVELQLATVVLEPVAVE